MNSTPQKRNTLTKEEEEELERAIHAGNLDEVKNIVSRVKRVPSKYLQILSAAHSYARKGATDVNELLVFNHIKNQLTEKSSVFLNFINFINSLKKKFQTKKNKKNVAKKLKFGGKRGKNTRKH